MKRFFLILLACALSWPVWAAGLQDIGQLQRLGEAFLKHELSQRAASWKTGKLDARLALPACAQPKADWANPGVTTGNTALTLSCPDQGWTLRLPVQINDKRMGVVLTRAVAAGEVLGEGDVKLVDVPNPALARNVLADLKQALGLTMKSGAPAGAWLRNFMVRAPYVIGTNQRVRVLANGDGFTVQSDGVALGNAAEGEQVSVRLPGGRVVRGVAQADGSVLVTY